MSENSPTTNNVKVSTEDIFRYLRGNSTMEPHYPGYLGQYLDPKFIAVRRGTRHCTASHDKPKNIYFTLKKSNG